MPQRRKHWKSYPGGAKGRVGDRYLEHPTQRPKPAENLQNVREQEARSRIAGLENSIKAINQNFLMPEETRNARIRKLRGDIQRIKKASPEIERAELLEEILNLDADRFKEVRSLSSTGVDWGGIRASERERINKRDNRLKALAAKLGLESRGEAIAEAKKLGIKIPKFS